MCYPHCLGGQCTTLPKATTAPPTRWWDGCQPLLGDLGAELSLHPTTILSWCCRYDLPVRPGGPNVHHDSLYPGETTLVQPGLVTSRVNSSSTVKPLLSEILKKVTQFASAVVVYGSPLPKKGNRE